LASSSKLANLVPVASQDFVDIELQLVDFETENLNVILSYLTDAYTSGVPVLCIVKYKNFQGDGDDSLTELLYRRRRVNKQAVNINVQLLSNRVTLRKNDQQPTCSTRLK
jgi:hypothetical protein